MTNPFQVGVSEVILGDQRIRKATADNWAGSFSGKAHECPKPREIEVKGDVMIALTKLTKPYNNLLVFKVLRDGFLKMSVEDAELSLQRIPVNLGLLPRSEAVKLAKQLKVYGALTEIK
jgi:hypothetical protein